MRRIRGKLSYANLTSTLCLFLLLGGGTAYAASHLGKNSVGAKQLKKGAVTPAKLAKASKQALSGPRGATGAPGAPGPKGDRGEVGPQGPGAISIDQVVGETKTPVATIEGVSILGACGPGSVGITLQSAVGSKLDYFGLRAVGSTVSRVFVENGGPVTTGPGSAEASIYYLARPSGSGEGWTRFDLSLDNGRCAVSGMATPSE
jgi:hypothetical protein